MKECCFYQKVDGGGEYTSDTSMENVAADGILTESFTLLFTVNRVLWQMIL